MSRPGIERLEDIRGRRIGVEETAAGALMLAKLLEAARLAPNDVVKVRLTADNHVKAYLAGEVDVVVCWEPYASQLQAKGAHRLFDSSRFPGLIVDVLVARADALKRVPDSFRQLVAGHFKALDHLHLSPGDALRRMTPRQGLSPDALRTILKGVHFVDLQANREWLGGSAPGLVPAANRVGRIMVSNGLLKQVPKLEGLADPRFLPSS